MTKYTVAMTLAAMFAVTGCESFTPDQRILVCTAARTALLVAQNHGLPAEDIAKYAADVDIACAFLLPPQAAAAETAAETVQ